MSFIEAYFSTEHLSLPHMKSCLHVLILHNSQHILLILEKHFCLKIYHIPAPKLNPTHNLPLQSEGNDEKQ